MVRLFRCAIAKFLRIAEALTLVFGGTPWKTGRFNRLMEGQVAAAAKPIARAEVIVGIPFHREMQNISRLTHILCRELEDRREPAVVVIVSERRTKHLLPATLIKPISASVSVVSMVKPFGFGQIGSSNPPDSLRRHQ